MLKKLFKKIDKLFLNRRFTLIALFLLILLSPIMPKEYGIFLIGIGLVILPWRYVSGIYYYVSGLLRKK